MLSLAMSPGRRLTWSPTLGRDPRVCCTAQPNSVTTGRPRGQTSMPSRMW
uniref:2',3'-cyclic nucleotide 3' phosphodiesterase n=1 Tax=Rhinolophus ferrumequinum TaxID=59479 RepID=A0A671EAT7_RHIFE